MFRFVSPVACMRRTALEDLAIGDIVISEREKLVLWFSAANRDPAVFAEPYEFRLDPYPMGT
jgi:cytochrome P450